MKKNYLKADVILIFVTLLAACGWIFSKETLPGLPPFLFIGLRFLLAGLVLGVVSGTGLFRLTAIQWRNASGAGLVFGAAMTLWIMGLHNTNHLGEGAFITSMGILLVPVIARLFFSDQPTRETWIALPVSVIGLACLSLNRPFSFETGQLYFLMAAGMFACHFTIISTLVTNIAPLSLSAIQLVIVGLCALLLSTGSETLPDDVSGSIWLWFLVSALIATSLRFWLQVKGQSFAPASHTVLILTLEPVWTAILASLWFGESMTGLQVLGCSFIFSALLVSRWRWVKALMVK
ncbi:MAG: EamA family transporter [Proteobacteria bacterium]|nr:MAG: EamA family transporter [Pseudomonadota bacterium]